MILYRKKFLILLSRNFEQSNSNFVEKMFYWNFMAIAKLDQQKCSITLLNSSYFVFASHVRLQDKKQDYRQVSLAVKYFRHVFGNQKKFVENKIMGRILEMHMDRMNFSYESIFLSYPSTIHLKLSKNELFFRLQVFPWRKLKKLSIVSRTETKYVLFLRSSTHY